MKLPTISKDELIHAVREGVRQAMENVVYATSLPGCDFSDMIREGIADGIERQTNRKPYKRKRAPTRAPARSNLSSLPSLRATKDDPKKDDPCDTQTPKRRAYGHDQYY